MIADLISELLEKPDSELIMTKDHFNDVIAVVYRYNDGGYRRKGIRLSVPIDYMHNAFDGNTEDNLDYVLNRLLDLSEDE